MTEFRFLKQEGNQYLLKQQLLRKYSVAIIGIAFGIFFFKYEMYFGAVSAILLSLFLLVYTMKSKIILDAGARTITFTRINKPDIYSFDNFQNFRMTKMKYGGFTSGSILNMVFEKDGKTKECAIWQYGPFSRSAQILCDEIRYIMADTREIKVPIEKEKVLYASEKEDIIYAPFGRGVKIDKWLILAGCLLSVAIIIWKYPLNMYDNWLFALAIGIMLIIVGTYRIFFTDGVILIFDARSRIIFKKYPYLFKVKVMDFEDAHSIITEGEDGCFCYCIARKRNVFGKNLKISESFREDKYDKERNRFEEQLLPAITKMLDASPTACGQ